MAKKKKKPEVILKWTCKECDWKNESSTKWNVVGMCWQCGMLHSWLEIRSQQDGEEEATQ